MLKRITYIITLAFFITSCSDTLGSVKRGLTGAKSQSTDEFLVKKKDPLILPPDFEDLPSPDSQIQSVDEKVIFENIFETSTEDNSSTSTSTENSILKKIQSK